MEIYKTLDKVLTVFLKLMGLLLLTSLTFVFSFSLLDRYNNYCQAKKFIDQSNNEIMFTKNCLNHRGNPRVVTVSDKAGKAQVTYCQIGNQVFIFGESGASN